MSKSPVNFFTIPNIFEIKKNINTDNSKQSTKILLTAKCFAKCFFILNKILNTTHTPTEMKQNLLH